MKHLWEYDHPYYCSESNYYSKEPSEVFDTFAEFYENYKDADIDLNLIFRFDVIREDGESGHCYARVFMIRQRKGIFAPITINDFKESDEQMARDILTEHWEKLKELWLPISNPNPGPKAGQTIGGEDG